MRENQDALAIYSRKSKFTGKGESIDNQIELCKDYIRAAYGEQALHRTFIYEDEGFSGGNLHRPAFQKMMAAAKRRKFHTIVVYRLDRISRNVSDFSTLIEQFSSLNIAFLSIKEQFDTSTPMGRAMMYIASVFSQLERETIAERIRDNMHELAKTGRWLGGITPTGYASEPVNNITMNGKTKKAYKLKLIPEEAQIIRTIYQLYIRFGSQTLTESELIKRGIKTKNGKYFTRHAIKGILQNPVYSIADQDAYNYLIKKEANLFSSQDTFDGTHGIIAYNRTEQEKGRTSHILPMTEWIIAVGGHPGIVSGKAWVSVQESLERSKCKSYQHPRKNEALLSGILFCSCGSPMYPKLSKRKNAANKSIYTYVCKMKERSQSSVCSSKNINGNELDAAVIEQIKSLSEDKQTFFHQLEQIQSCNTGIISDCEEELKAMYQKQAALEKKINTLVDSLVELHEPHAKAHIIRRVEQLHQESEQIHIHIEKLQAQKKQQLLSDGERMHLHLQLLDWKQSVDRMAIEQKRIAISTLVRKVIWDNGTAHVVLFGVPDDPMDFAPQKTLSWEDSK